MRGKRLRPRELEELFSNGHFEERVSQSVVFAVLEGGRSILFDFTQFRVWKYSELRKVRIGRLLHPYITRVQQRYGLFVQRQALPRVPDSAVVPQESEGPGEGGTAEGLPGTDCAGVDASRRRSAFGGVAEARECGERNEAIKRWEKPTWRRLGRAI